MGAENLKPGDKVLLTEMEHHSNIVPWQLITRRTGAKLAFIPVTGDEGLLDLSRLDELLDGAKTRLADPHFKLARNHQPGRRNLQARARRRRRDPCRCCPKRRPQAH